MYKFIVIFLLVSVLCFNGISSAMAPKQKTKSDKFIASYVKLIQKPHKNSDTKQFIKKTDKIMQSIKKKSGKSYNSISKSLKNTEKYISKKKISLFS